MPLRLSKGRNKTCRRTLIRDLQISRAVKRRTTTRRRCRWTRRSATCDSAAQRINWSALFGIARERSLRIPMVVNDRYAKQSADRTHFYTFQSEGQFNCGGRPIRASAIFSASNRPPETVNVCARTTPNDIYIYIDTALNGILNNGECLNAFATAA